jgi:fructosamine-3-kinase
LAALGLGDRIVSIRRLSGGQISDPWLVGYADGTRVVGKTAVGAPADLFRCEAAGLAVLRADGHVPTPQVRAVTGRLLVLEALEARDDSQGSWEVFAGDLAGLHRGTASDRFGWPADGYLGRLPQANGWRDSGHEFFAEHRLLRYLREPPVRQALTGADRRALERLCDRLADVVPVMPAVLTHGDLWCGNLLSRADGRITVIDPAVCYTWAEVDLSMLWCCPRPAAADRFFEIYQELNPSPPGWAGRMPLLHLRELLSTVAHTGDSAATGRIRDILAPFSAR